MSIEIRSSVFYIVYFTKETDRKDCGYKKNSQLHSERNIKIKIIVLARKPAAIMEIVKSVLRYIEHIKNMYQIV